MVRLSHKFSKPHRIAATISLVAIVHFFTNNMSIPELGALKNSFGQVNMMLHNVDL